MSDARDVFIMELVWKMRRDLVLFPTTAILTIDRTIEPPQVGEFRTLDGFAEPVGDPVLIEQVRGVHEKFPADITIVLTDEDGAFVRKASRSGPSAKQKHKVPPQKPQKPPPLECGKIAPNGYPCFLPTGHATPAPVDYPTPRYHASPEEIEKYRQARFGCIGRPPKRSAPK